MNKKATTTTSKMKIVRIDQDKRDQDIHRIEIEIGPNRWVITREKDCWLGG
jgi:hypothetical protein